MILLSVIVSFMPHCSLVSGTGYSEPCILAPLTKKTKTCGQTYMCTHTYISIAHAHNTILFQFYKVAFKKQKHVRISGMITLRVEVQCLPSSLCLHSFHQDRYHEHLHSQHVWPSASQISLQTTSIRSQSCWHRCACHENSIPKSCCYLFYYFTNLQITPLL